MKIKKQNLIYKEEKFYDYEKHLEKQYSSM